MKVPTYKKYGLSKREFDNINSRSRRVSNLLAHDIPLVLGIVVGIALWIFTYRKVNPSGFLGTTSQIFVFGTIGLICVGIPMLIFKGAEKLYFAYMKRKSSGFKSAVKYEEAREKYDFWKIRKDESYWKLLDGLSFENESLAVLKKIGYTPRGDKRDGNTQIISKGRENFLLIFRTSQSTPGISEIETAANSKPPNIKGVIMISSRPFAPEIVKRAKDYPISLLSLKELTDMVRTIKE